MISEASLPHQWLDRADLELVSTDDLGAFLVGLETEVDHLEQQRALVLAEFDNRKAHDIFGFPSTVAFLMVMCRMAGGRAKRLVNRARAAAAHRTTFTAWWCGQLSGDQAQQLLDVSDQLPDLYPDAEAVLVDIAGETPEDTRQVLDYWKHTADRPGVDLDLESQQLRRRFDMNDQSTGMVEGRFVMTGAAGLALRTAVDALLPPPGAGDTRSASQRRHDAPEDLAYSFLETTNTRTTGGEKPHLNVHVDIDALRGEPGGLHETTSGQVLGVETIRQLACDASVTRIVFGPGSEILDVGRKTRVVHLGLRRAAVARDRHCRTRGCRRPAQWCDLHHIIHWADGGETRLENLILLCRYHHTLLHRLAEAEQEQFELIQLDRVTETSVLRDT